MSGLARNTEDRTESPETNADVLTVTHASKPGQTVGTGEFICLAIINRCQPSAIVPEDRILKPLVQTAMTI